MPTRAEILPIVSDLRRLHIKTKEDDELREELDFNVMRGPDGVVRARQIGRIRETRCICVVGASGAGKSTAVEAALNRFELLRGPPDGAPLWVSGEVPSPPSLKNLAFGLTKKSGYEIAKPTESTAWAAWVRLQERMAAQGRVVLHIDEAHDLFSRDAAGVLRAIKSFMQGDMAVTVILSGLPELEELVRGDPQVWRRCTIVRMRPLSDLLEEDRERVEGVVSTLAAKVSLRPEWPDDLSDRLIVAARACFGTAVEITQDAIEGALMEGEGCLAGRHFTHTWERRERTGPQGNPFFVDDFRSLDLDIETEEEALAPKKRRRGVRR